MWEGVLNCSADAKVRKKEEQGMGNLSQQEVRNGAGEGQLLKGNARSLLCFF